MNQACKIYSLLRHGNEGERRTATLPILASIEMKTGDLPATARLSLESVILMENHASNLGSRLLELFARHMSAWW
jgi:hypothetical protein